MCSPSEDYPPNTIVCDYVYQRLGSFYCRFWMPNWLPARHPSSPISYHSNHTNKIGHERRQWRIVCHLDWMMHRWDYHRLNATFWLVCPHRYSKSTHRDSPRARRPANASSRSSIGKTTPHTYDLRAYDAVSPYFLLDPHPRWWRWCPLSQWLISGHPVRTLHTILHHNVHSTLGQFEWGTGIINEEELIR